MTATPGKITLFGFDGTTQPSNEELWAAVRNELTRAGVDMTDETAVRNAHHNVMTRVIAGYLVAEYHNKTVVLLAAYHLAVAAVRFHVNETDQAYAKLTTRAPGWHAAHHNYIVAATKARAAYATLLGAAGPLGQHHKQEWSGMTSSFYNQLVPEHQRILMPDLAGIPTQVAEFTERNRERMQLLSYTITGGTPLGFEPEQVPETTAADTDAGSYRLRNR